jgi:hypothetical protein
MCLRISCISLQKTVSMSILSADCGEYISVCVSVLQRQFSIPTQLTRPRVPTPNGIEGMEGSSRREGLIPLAASHFASPLIPYATR